MTLGQILWQFVAIAVVWRCIFYAVCPPESRTIAVRGEWRTYAALIAATFTMAISIAIGPFSL